MNTLIIKWIIWFRKINFFILESKCSFVSIFYIKKNFFVCEVISLVLNSDPMTCHFFSETFSQKVPQKFWNLENFRNLVTLVKFPKNEIFLEEKDFLKNLGSFLNGKLFIFIAPTKNIENGKPYTDLRKEQNYWTLTNKIPTLEKIQTKPLKLVKKLL